MSLKEESVVEKAAEQAAPEAATKTKHTASLPLATPTSTGGMATGELPSENVPSALAQHHESSPSVSNAPPSNEPRSASAVEPQHERSLSHPLTDLKELEDESASLSLNSDEFSHARMRDSSVSISSLSGISPPSDDSIFHRIQRFEDASEVDLPLEAHRRPQMTGVGAVLDNKYRITHKIAEGGMGIVYGAAHTKLGKQVAIKVIAPGTLSNEESRRRFVREAKASTLLSSPHTVRVYDYNVSQWGEPYLVMEFVSGTNLNQLLKTNKEPMDPERAVHITKQIAQSLMEAHANGLIHRDLKPSNVMLMHLKGHDDFVKIFDFGVVKFADAPEESDLTRQGVVLGTPRYMAPEQIMAPSSVSFPADIFSLGLILYYMLTGEKPFGDASQDMVRISRITGKSVNIPKQIDIPLALRALYSRMTANDPQKRPNAEEVYLQLKEIENELKAGTFSGSHSFNNIRSGGFFGSVYGKASIFLSIPLLIFAAWWLRPKEPTKQSLASSSPRSLGKASPETKAPSPKTLTVPSKQPAPRPPKAVLPVVTSDAGAPPESAPPEKATPETAPQKATPPSRRTKRRWKRRAREREYRLTSSPSGAKVYGPQNKYLGKTPLTVKKSLGQSATYLLKRGGYFTYKLVIPAKAKSRTYNTRLREISIEMP